MPIWNDEDREKKAIMKLQIALDGCSLEEAIALVKKTEPYIDIVEVGTPLLFAEGMRVVSIMKNCFPEKEILADMKIMDAGGYEIEEAYRRGADYATVLAVTDLATVDSCVKMADQYGKKVFADLICVGDIGEKVRQLEHYGIHGIAVHTGVDQQAYGRTPLDDLREVVKYREKAEVSVAGGINIHTIRDYIALKPDVMIAGGALCKAENPCEAARQLKDAILHSVC